MNHKIRKTSGEGIRTVYGTRSYILNDDQKKRSCSAFCFPTFFSEQQQEICNLSTDWPAPTDDDKALAEVGRDKDTIEIYKKNKGK